MLLAIDIGNSDITIGLWNGEAWVSQWRIPSRTEFPEVSYAVKLRDLFLEDSQAVDNVKTIVLSSVVPGLTEKIKNVTKSLFEKEPILLGPAVYAQLPLTILSPHEIGSDLVANAVGAYFKLKQTCIVVDFGTATSFDIVNQQGEFIGGIIAPGLNLQMKVLNKFTSKLPKIDVATADKVIGNNTSEAILSGVIRGSASMIDGLVLECEKELGSKVTLIATGGYSGLISSYLKRPFDFINPTLTLEGLRFLYDLNAKKKV